MMRVLLLRTQAVLMSARDSVGALSEEKAVLRTQVARMQGALQRVRLQALPASPKLYECVGKEESRGVMAAFRAARQHKPLAAAGEGACGDPVRRQLDAEFAKHSPMLAARPPTQDIPSAYAALEARDMPDKTDATCAVVILGSPPATPPSLGRKLHKDLRSALAAITRSPAPLSGQQERTAVRTAATRYAYKESSRLHIRRTVFDFDDWADHRSSARYFRHIRDLAQSRIVRGLAQPLLVVVVVSTAVSVYETLREDGFWVMGQWPSLCLESDQAVNLTSFALSLLLVFRTNTSYARWLDARRVFGGILNRSRDIVRQGLTWFDDDQTEECAMLARWTVAFSLATMAHLRKECHLERDLQDILPEEERAMLLAARHRPNAALQVLSQVIATANPREGRAARMDENLTFFFDAVGLCERILKTPIPLSYTRHTSRFLVIWLIFLPLTLWPTAGWTTVPATTIIAFLLLGIEEIGVQIEEPFSILPLENLCVAVKEDIAEMCGEGSGMRSLVKRRLPRASQQSSEPAQAVEALSASGNGAEQS
ncbi:hypothetical protein WJX81_003973 [Elliptochloris bilobata]|uniref:Uncharacterized protein n=1 Tax=Elliptochloris bilobata TaxID=381761 RepID=A0AAW1RKD4_9CHLO